VVQECCDTFPAFSNDQEGVIYLEKREYVLILTIVNRGFADQVVDAARKAGAHGGTVFYARGTGIHEIEKFFAVPIQPEKEVVMIIVKHSETQAIMHAIVEAAGLNTEGKGLAFSLPIAACRISDPRMDGGEKSILWKWQLLMLLKTTMIYSESFISTELTF
jgi:nitrogen regulatory protein P-II 1